MKRVRSMVVAACVLFFVTGVAHAVDLDDLGVTIRMIDSDDMKGVSNELRLPDAAADAARRGKGLARANEVRERNESRKQEHGSKHDDKDAADDKLDDHEDHKSSRDESMESHDETKESQEETKEEHTETQDHDDKYDRLEGDTSLNTGG